MVQKPFTIIHIGTNDINSNDKLSVDAIMSYFNNLITVIRDVSSTHIILSSILPRPVDYTSTNGKVKEVNARLKVLCKTRHCQFVQSFKSFFKGGKPIRELFSVRDGGLHLNLEGIRQLKKVFIKVVAHLVKGKIAT